jgi:hypothetical protein
MYEFPGAQQELWNLVSMQPLQCLCDDLLVQHSVCWIRVEFVLHALSDLHIQEGNPIAILMCGRGQFKRVWLGCSGWD